MIKLTCPQCQHDIIVNMHFYDIKLCIGEDPIGFNRTYEAQTRGDAICPDCGYHMHRFFSRAIPLTEICDLAVGKGRQI